MNSRASAGAWGALLATVIACGETSTPEAEADASTPPVDATLDTTSEAAPESVADGTNADAHDASVDAPRDVLDSGDAEAEAASDDPVLLDGELPPHPTKLPFSFERPEDGDPVSDADLAEATRLYLETLEQSHYFAGLDALVHGWPEDDPKKRYWFGTWWVDTTIEKNAGKVTFFHHPGGADNNGVPTGMMLEGVCYSYLLGKDPAMAHLAHRLVRGFSSWILAMEREPDDPDAPILSRSFYPASISTNDRGHEVFIDYDQNHGGEDNGASFYVHIPKNPHWGDLWVKSKRSKDDIGRMMKGLALLDPCLEALRGTDFEADALDLRKRYAAWSRTVEDSGWVIRALDTSGNVWLPPDELAHYFLLGNLECDGALAFRLMGRGNTGSLDCGNGVSSLDQGISDINHQNGAILRSHHQAAAAWALLWNEQDVAKSLLGGLVGRMERGLDAELAGKPQKYLPSEDLAAMLVDHANVGVPLTWREVRYLHQQIGIAHSTYPTSALGQTNPWDPSVPDGTYAFGPWGAGFGPAELGQVLGTCVSPYRNPKSKPVLDCDAVAAALRK